MGGRNCLLKTLILVLGNRGRDREFQEGIGLEDGGGKKSGETFRRRSFREESELSPWGAKREMKV